jgi:hypothetical protein
MHRVIRIAAAAALGLALSACGGTAKSSSAETPSAASAQSSISGPAPTQSSTPPQSTSGDSGTPADATGPGSSGSGSGSSGSGSAGSGSTSGNPPSSNNVTINWDSPTENTDGSALTDLAGFKIYYGTASGKYTHTITVRNPGLATYVVSDLAAGTYYFSVTAYGSDGTESPHSSEVAATVQ